MHFQNILLKRFIIHISIIFASIFVVLLLVECGLRTAGFNPFGSFFENPVRSVFIRPSSNPDRVFEATPNVVGTAWGTHFSINSFGFRGREYTREKPNDIYRIIALGDSITFGNQLPADANYPAVLEKLFSQSGQKVEVLNFGLGAYDTLQEVATFEDIGLQFQPDFVVLGYCINDIDVSPLTLNYIKRLQVYDSLIYRSRLAQFIRSQMDRIEIKRSTIKANDADSFDISYKNSMADISQDTELRSLMDQLSRILTHKNVDNIIHANSYILPGRVKLLRFALEKLKTLQLIGHFHVGVVIFPYLLEDSNSHEACQLIYDIVKHEARRLGFSIVDIYSEFVKSGLDTLAINKNDGIHPNQQGHLIVAQTLYKFISSHELRRN